MKFSKEIHDGIINALHQYIVRYCDMEYVFFIESFISDLLHQEIILPAETSEDKIVNSAHTLFYDNKVIILGGIQNVVGKNIDFSLEDFLGNILKLMRGCYIDGIINSPDINYPTKIMVGKFFMNFIENISLIEDINFDEYFKLKDFVNQKNIDFKTIINEELERINRQLNPPDDTLAKKVGYLIPEPKTVSYYYWHYPIEYMTKFETLLLSEKYNLINKHDNFSLLFKEYSETPSDNPIKFKGTRAELYYILYRVYDDFFNNKIPLYKFAGNLFDFVGKSYSKGAMYSSYQKFINQMNSTNKDEYIQ